MGGKVIEFEARKVFNEGKEETLKLLVRDGLITEEEASRYSETKTTSKKSSGKAEMI